MRKVIFQNMISLDGYFEGPNREIDWHNVDEEFNEIARAFLDTVDTLLFGRLTYQIMANYWPTELALNDDPIIANKMNNLSKVVFSKTLDKVDWQNSRLVKGNIAEEVARLKQAQGKDMAIFGSSDLALALIPDGLIDEIRIMINPIVLGEGKPIFAGIRNRINLKLIKTETFKSGNVALHYQFINK
ncbi:MAG: dihydrofolate reductase family protein [FCB group bacterium]